MADAVAVPSPSALEPEPAFTFEEPRQLHLTPPEPRERSKKEAWLADKAGRRDVHVTDAELKRRTVIRRPTKAGAADDGLAPVGTRITPITTLFNVWTREALPLLPGRDVETLFHGFLRDHYTNQATRMDVRLVGVLTNVARRFRAPRIEVVSGYRSPKYNLMLRKKGHEVARSSQHTEGNAVDFRIRGVATPVLLRYVRGLRQGGVGFYPRSQFVHSDTGPIRFWRGT